MPAVCRLPEAFVALAAALLGVAVLARAEAPLAQVTPPPGAGDRA